MRRSFLSVLCVCALALVAIPRRSTAAPGHTVLVFAAASLTNALEAVDRAFTAATHIPVKESFASSAVVAKQIASGAPAEVFLSANLKWMDYLEKQHLLAPGSRQDLLGNRLVLIAPAGSRVHLAIAPHFDLARALGTGRLAIGEPDTVPAGIYARQALTHLGVWTQVSSRLAPAENVRAALAYVARGEAPLGIVYRTDALQEKHVRIVGVFPESTHPPIRYPVALLIHASPEAMRLLHFYRSPRAKEIFRSYGFQALE